MTVSTVDIPDAFLIGTDNCITVNELKDKDGADIGDATFTGNLYDRAGNVVASNITFTLVGGSASNYRGILPNNTALVECQEYELIAVAVKGSRKLTLRVKRPAKYVEA